ncbi:uncharacterized protein LOC106667365 isoform X2 [Cimex lectularius]|nr:uncharacterized protein LOC106667365 isoform X2 [Cimex lectularius]
MLHAYGFAISFLVLAFYAFFSILNIRSLITKRPYMSTINVFLCVLSSSRAVCLFIDPYALKNIMPRLLGLAIWDLGFPSLVSALALLQLALLRLTQIPSAPQPLKNSSCLSLAITLHFASVLAIDTTLALHPHVLVAKYVVDTAFHVWGAAVCAVFLYSGVKAMRVLSDMPSAMLERDIDAQYKGIMQLAMLAPYNNLATSVAAALVPTLLAPKLVHEKKGIAASSSSSKTEPVKSCILKPTPKPSPNSSDNEEPRTTDQGQRRTKKLSWGPERRISGQLPKKASGTRLEEENEDVNTSLLPQRESKSDLTLDAILNHIAYMNRGGVSETTQSRKQRLRNVLRLTTLTPFLALLFVLTSLFRIYDPAWYDGYKKWLAFETCCRSLEVVIAWSMANLTKQPVSNHSITGYQTHGSKQSMFM